MKLLLDYLTTLEKFRSQGQDKDPVQLARDIRASGIDIITVGLKQSIVDDLAVFETKIRIPTFLQQKIQEFAKIATPGMAFNDIDTDLVGEIQRSGLCQRKLQIRKYF